MVQHFEPGETIAAISTPPGEGGIAVIRISGSKSIDCANTLFSGNVSSYKTHTAHYGKVIARDGSVIDHALLLLMRGPHSYTGEDTVEINCHGGTVVTRQVLEAAIHAGARAARPGEFTFKAFCNGRIDLAQAEAVQELIAAKSELAAQAAHEQLEGRLSHEVLTMQKDLTEIAAILEAWVDFPEEGIEFASLEDLCKTLELAMEKITHLLKTFHDGKRLFEGISLCLIGKPNVGKSSLMNALLGKDRAIVTNIPGTTRDLLEDHLTLNQLNLRLIDTAGIHESSEIVEIEGIKRSKQALESADIILYLLDASKKFEGILDIPKERSILIWNKIDIQKEDLPELGFPHTVEISALEHTGLDALKKAIDALIWENGPPSKEEVLISNTRHKEALESSLANCLKVVDGLKREESPEFIAFDMRKALSDLGSIIGMDISEDILSAIFSKFCIGK